LVDYFCKKKTTLVLNLILSTGSLEKHQLSKAVRHFL